LKAVVLSETGGPEQLVYTDAPDPEAPDGSTVLNVRAAGINFMDVLVRRGEYPQPPPLPAILGAEVAGELEDGRRVLGLTRASGGGYAERALVEDAWLLDLPPEASFAEGASFLMTFLTVWIPLQWQAPVRPGSSVLVHAGAGGVGSAAIQLARQAGAQVFATASEHKHDVVRGLGAVPVPYEGFAEGVRAATDGRGVDVVVDPVGGEVFEQSLGALAPLGSIVAIGYAGGMWPQLNPALVVGRNISVHGFYLGRLMKLDPRLVQSAAQDVLALWEAGEITPLVGAEFALADAAEAHRLIEDRQSTGKVVLVP
jgi:NADPH2:quinone reductase